MSLRRRIHHHAGGARPDCQFRMTRRREFELPYTLAGRFNAAEDGTAKTDGSPLTSFIRGHLHWGTFALRTNMGGMARITANPSHRHRGETSYGTDISRRRCTPC